MYISVPSFAFLFFLFRQRINPATSVKTLALALLLNYGYRCPLAQCPLSLMNMENEVQPGNFSTACSFFTLIHVTQRYTLFVSYLLLCIYRGPYEEIRSHAIQISCQCYFQLEASPSVLITMCGCCFLEMYIKTRNLFTGSLWELHVYVMRLHLWPF